MGTIETAAHVTPEPSATELLKRDVADVIRNLTPASNKLLAIVASGQMKNGELMKSSKGMITKRKTFALRVEGFTHTPLPVTRTVSSFSGVVATMSDASSMQVKQKWLITRNKQEGIIDAISGSDVTFIAADGTNFSLAEGDVLLRTGNSYEEGSTNPPILAKTDDNYYNVCNVFRFPVEIALEAMPNPQLAGGNYFERMNRNNLIFAMRSIENSLLFSERAATANKTTMTTLGVSVPHLRGMWNWAQSTYDLGGSFTPSKFRKEVGTRISDTVHPEKRLIMFCSKQTNALMQEWPMDSGSIVRISKSGGGELNKFGIKSTTFTTAQNEIEVVPHDSFNQGGLTNSALIFAPDDWEYIYMNGQDLRPNNNIQDPSTLGKKNELTGCISILPKDGGNNALTLTSIF